MQEALFKLADFDIIKTLQQTHQQTTTIKIAKLKGKLVILKIINKSYFSDSKRIEHLKNEKEALEYFTKQNVQNINHLIGTFKDETNIYFVLEPAYGVALHRLMTMSETFDPLFVGMIIAQVGLILQEFHKEGFIYRDIKASNFMIDGNGRVTMIDLGKAKRISGGRTMTLCGTTHAIPPEILFGEGKYEYSYEFDYYSFGILLYELLVGKATFGYQNQNPTIKQDIQNGLMPQHLDQIEDQTASDLITKLLNPPSHRLGKSNGWTQILSHPYFKKINLTQIKQIMSGNPSSTPDYNFKVYQQDIQAFGIEEDRYDQIKPDDIFSKF